MTEKAASERASTAAILFFTESLKLIFSSLLLLGEHRFSFVDTLQVIGGSLQNPQESFKLAIPAIVFAIQNGLLQIGSAHLSAALWQVTYQCKILVTAFFSVVLLQKSIKRAQWLAIAIMAFGIAAVQLSDAKEEKQASMANAAEQNVAKGLIVMLIACCCSGFASVYTELIFKNVGSDSSQKKASVWLQNMQLAFFTMLITLFTFGVGIIMSSQQSADVDFSLLRGFTPKVWIMAVNNAVGGLLVALVIKHADNILRGFAGAFATVASTIIAVFAFDFVLSATFGVGTVMVLGSALMYGGVIKIPGDWWNSELRLFETSSYKAVATTEVSAPQDDDKTPMSESKDSAEKAKNFDATESEMPGNNLVNVIGHKH